MSTAKVIKDSASKIAQAAFPYWPLDSEIPGYAVNVTGRPQLLTLFFGACTILCAATYFGAQAAQPRLTHGAKMTMMWFVLSGTIHIFFEGYLYPTHATLGSLQTVRAQLWKEYAFSDSRYLTSDAFVITMETVTAYLWGPGCIATAAMILNEHPLRYPLQLIVSLGQLYGVVLYYATSMWDHYLFDRPYSRPEPFYFYFYFVTTNAFWVFIPAYLIYRSVVVSSRAIALLQRTEASKKAS